MLQAKDLPSKIDTILNHVVGIHSDTNTVKSDLGLLVNRVDLLEANVQELQREVLAFRSKLLFVKNSVRACNLIIFNVPDSVEVNTDLCSSIVTTFTASKIVIRRGTIVSVSRLGKKWVTGL